MYSHLSNSQAGWNKCGGGANVAKSINMEVGINVEGGIFWKKLVHNCNNNGGWKKSKKLIKVEGRNVLGGWIFFSKSISLTSRLLERREYT